MNLRKAASFAALGALIFLAGCLEFDAENSISWSPSGTRVAFLSEGKAWIYSLDSGSMRELPTSSSYMSIAWSPREDWIAVSTSAYVEIFREQDGTFQGGQTFSTTDPSPDMSSVLVWHPDGRKLLYSEFAGESATTTEVDLDSGVVTHMGAGIGLYGPGADWLLWAAPVPIGRRGEKMIFDRQNLAGDSLPLDKDVSILEGGFFEMLSSLNDNSPLPLCARRDNPGKPGSELHCLDAQGRLERRAFLPAGGRAFPDRRRALFAVVGEAEDGELRLAVYDSRGALKADGARFLRKIDEAASSGDREAKSLRASRLAWSPDGNWIACVINGRLCLWNWRNDEARVHSPPRLVEE